MNSIPSIFNERQVKRTILGGSVTARNVRIPISVILLNRCGSHYRARIIDNLL